MTTESKYKWALTGLIVMVLLNAVTLITLWTNRPDLPDMQMHREGERGRNAVHQFMQKELGLTTAQMDSIDSYRKSHFRKMEMMREELEQARRAYFDFVLGPEADNSQKRDSLLSDMTRQYVEMEEAFYTHMADMKNVLDSEQRQKFKRLMRDTMMRDHKGKMGGRNR